MEKVVTEESKGATNPFPGEKKKESTGLQPGAPVRRGHNPPDREKVRKLRKHRQRSVWGKEGVKKSMRYPLRAEAKTGTGSKN